MIATDGSIYLGRPGMLVALPNRAGTIDTTPEQPSTTETTITGRVLEQHAPLTRRSWKVAIPRVTAAQAGALSAMRRTIPGPWAMVTVDAANHNALSPRDADFATAAQNGSVAGPVVIGQQFFASRLVPGSDGWVNIGRCPVIPGMPITASAWVTGFAEQSRVFVGIRFLDAAGQEVGTMSWGYMYPGLTTYQRLYTTGTVPPSAAHAEMHVVSAGNIAGPAISWTPRPTPWSDGRGAPKVYTSPIHESLLAGTDGAHYDLSFDVQEIG